jgi:hypothetical protein
MNVSQEESLSRGQAESVIQQGPECGTANVALENWRETRRSVRLLYYEASGNMRMGSMTSRDQSVVMRGTLPNTNH